MSFKSIQPLDSNVINRLRSSLVISSLAQCLKELIHNALDANATNIDIHIDIEKFSLQVNDNGYGIQNMDKIGQRHVTSKCHALSDINQLKTFGFRGEALAAITNMSLTQIISRHYLSKETFEGFWRDSKLVGEISPSKHTRKNYPGTSVIVRDLFYKVPVRRKYQQSSSSYQHVVTMESVKRLVITFALCFHHVSFTLIDSNRNMKIVSTKKAHTSLDIFRQLFGQDMSKYAQPINIHKNNLEITGFFSTQSYPNKSQQYIYINNYIVPSTNELYKIVSDLFSSSSFAINTEKVQITPLKSRGRFIQKYPIYVIQFSCPTWSNYEINSYLGLLTHFKPLETIASVLKEITTQFLKSSGFLIESPQQKKIKRPRLTNTSTVDKSIINKNHPPSHSPFIVPSITDNSNHSQLTSKNDSKIKQTPNSSFITWWDPNRNEAMYIDPRTGSSYYSSELENSPVEISSHQDKIDRSSLKRAERSYSDTLIDINTIQQTDHSKHRKVFSHSTCIDIPYKLTKHDLHHIQVLGQIDKKFIAVKLLNTQHLIIFDQHAADERIKLEEIYENFEIVTLEPVIQLDFDLNEIQWLMSDHVLNYFKIWGIHIIIDDLQSSSETVLLSQSRFFAKPDNHQKIKSNQVYITRLPRAIIDKCITNHHILKDIIRDHLYWIMEQTDEILTARTCPKGITEILKSKACRNAIMFNDELSLEQCKTIIQKLSACNFPFQCAHGRPSAIPIKLYTRYQKPSRPKNWKKFEKKKAYK
ncbi:uncharacterized protein BX663DRAFT_505679 [Cokeromyces recurvatus]|uniref:uncharacterized protein n=1 Tax=Cokeromyces recurvatus TaxID=90255 RepID=UPI00221FD5B1|nr:uncharacterized protein BX663DRAFT_505679 [Cokeromyces recurvatus]KAI7903915.1 hypothetical protein BX663DRAFT_505679 [Cokeromyces recurvatus]